MKGFAFKFPQVSHIGNTVSHAKNRKKRAFKYNLHTVTVMIDGKRQRMRVPTRILRMLKKSGMTTHYKPEEKQVQKPLQKLAMKPAQLPIEPKVEALKAPKPAAKKKKAAKKAKK